MREFKDIGWDQTHVLQDVRGDARVLPGKQKTGRDYTQSTVGYATSST
jgi:hypothetical protein